MDQPVQGYNTNMCFSGNGAWDMLLGRASDWAGTCGNRRGPESSL